MELRTNTPRSFFWYAPILSLVLLLSLSACGDVSSSTNVAKAGNTESALATTDEPFVIQHENFEDPEFAKTPRVQFVWNPPGTPENRYGRGIWSMRLDGSDLRLAVPPELFTSPAPGSFDMTVPFERSPNLRYIAWVMEGDCPTYCYQRRLIDLKTKEVKVLTSESGGPPRFLWTKDSRHLYFKFRGRLNRYDVDTDQVVDIDDRFEKKTTEGFTLSEDEKMLIGATTKSIYYYNMVSGRMLKSLPMAGSKKFSADGKYVLVGDMARDLRTALSTEDMSEIFSMPMSAPFPAPFIANQPIFFATHDSIRKKALFNRIEWMSGKEEAVTELPAGGGRASNLSYIFKR